MKVAITGANGFIGRNLVNFMLGNTADLEVIAIVRDAGSIDCNAGEALKVVQIDIHKPPVNAYELIGAPDILIHLAWDGLANYNSSHHFESELPKHYEFLSDLVRNGLKSLVVTGTCFEYGMQSGELNEKIVAIPDNSYGFAKNTLREQLEYLQKETEFNFTWARLFYLYGNSQTGNSIFPQLKRAVENNDEVFNMSKGEQLRDYLDVEEVARLIMNLALLEKNIGLINVCSGIPVSIRRLVEEWIVKYSWTIKLNLGYYPYPTYEPMAFWGCTEKLHTTLGVVTDER